MCSTACPERDARRVAGNVAFDVLRAGFDLTAAAAALDDGGNEVLTDRRGGWEDRAMAGIALHRAAAALRGATAPPTA